MARSAARGHDVRKAFARSQALFGDLVGIERAQTLAIDRARAKGEGSIKVRGGVVGVVRVAQPRPEPDEIVLQSDRGVILEFVVVLGVLVDLAGIASAGKRALDLDGGSGG